ncbi:hypothetical protein [Corynebacterium sp. 13CS0277]|uniref:hypothetical protein n=1 Tax=Corynebacterium sp. 13CS0277 TaxID=2071994 RepID=UPI0011B1CC8A|nr:hypothetical protein [Corynebacterium sp. 13CS0277]
MLCGGGAAKAITATSGPWGVCCGVVAALITVGMLLRFLPQVPSQRALQVLRGSWPWIAAGTVAGAASMWERGVSWVAVVNPLLMYLFSPGNDRFVTWLEHRPAAQ